ncbi:MAG: extensin family protein [Reyranellaceae bacterium]
MPHAVLADRDQGGGCRFQDAVRFSGAGLAAGGGVILTCRMAVAMAMFERHVLQPAAQAHFRQNVVGLQHLGSYACRNVYSRKTGRLSEHAWANAIDVAGFRLEGGRVVSVARDWRGEGPPAQFLREVRRGACRFFKVVLGPDYNAAHGDHFHFDMARYSVCR